MSTKKTTLVIGGMVVLLFTVMFACGTPEENDARPTPAPVRDEEISVPDDPDAEVDPGETRRGGLVPKPIQIGPKSGGNLQFKEDGDVITPIGGSSIRDDLTGAPELFKGKLSQVVALQALGEIRFTFKDGMIGNTQQYSDVTVTHDASGLSWKLNGGPVSTCDPCDETCAAELIPSVMLNEMSGPILAKRDSDTAWIEIDHVAIKMLSAPSCPE